ncbi:hypothetical protein KRR40_45390 [Niabella defluvii]|nr:hypothetical protein KRR40_45390 [Niabella sp. I65]
MFAGTKVGGWFGMNKGGITSIEVGATESIVIGRNSLVGIETPYGTATQSASTAASRAAFEVEQGATLYRMGTLGRSQAGEAQFWSLENPAKYLNDMKAFASKFGIPEENLQSGGFFIESGKLRQTGFFITREAPGVGANSGGAVEVVVRPGTYT